VFKAKCIYLGHFYPSLNIRAKHATSLEVDPSPKVKTNKVVNFHNLIATVFEPTLKGHDSPELLVFYLI